MYTVFLFGPQTPNYTCSITKKESEGLALTADKTKAFVEEETGHTKQEFDTANKEAEAQLATAKKRGTRIMINAASRRAIGTLNHKCKEGPHFTPSIGIVLAKESVQSSFTFVS